MDRLNLAAGFVVQFLSLQCLDLGFGQDNRFLRDFGFQSIQAILEVGKVISQPNASDSDWGYEYSNFVQFIVDPNLAIDWENNGVFQDSRLGLRINTIFDVRLLPVGIEQRIDSVLLNGTFVAVKRISGHDHELACPGHIAKFLRQVQ